MADAVPAKSRSLALCTEPPITAIHEPQIGHRRELIDRSPMRVVPNTDAHPGLVRPLFRRRPESGPPPAIIWRHTADTNELDQPAEGSRQSEVTSLRNRNDDLDPAFVRNHRSHELFPQPILNGGAKKGSRAVTRGCETVYLHISTISCVLDRV